MPTIQSIKQQLKQSMQSKGLKDPNLVFLPRRRPEKIFFKFLFGIFRDFGVSADPKKDFCVYAYLKFFFHKFWGPRGVQKSFWYFFFFSNSFPQILGSPRIPRVQINIKNFFLKFQFTWIWINFAPPNSKLFKFSEFLSTSWIIFSADNNCSFPLLTKIKSTLVLENFHSKIFSFFHRDLLFLTFFNSF